MKQPFLLDKKMLKVDYTNPTNTTNIFEECCASTPEEYAQKAASIGINEKLRHKINRNIEMRKQLIFKEQENINEWNEWCKSNEVDPIFACINFVYHLNDIDTVILGVNSKRELINNLKAVGESKEYKLKADFRDFKSSNLNLIDPRRWAV